METPDTGRDAPSPDTDASQALAAGLDAVGTDHDPTLSWEEIPPSTSPFLPLAFVRVLGAWVLLASYGTVSIILVALGANPDWVLTRVMGQWCRAELWWLGIAVEFEHLERVPRTGSFILMANHQSLLEIFVYGSFFDRPCFYTMKKEFARIPVLGWFLRQVNQVFLDRRDRESAIRELARGAELLKRGYCTSIFPEGTRRPHGTLGPFKKGPFHLAIQSRVPVLPVAALNTGALLPAKSVWCRPGTIRMVVCEPIDTSGWAEETLEAHLVEVRRAIARPLAEYRSSLGHSGL